MNSGFYKKTISLTVIMVLCQGLNLLRDVLLARNLGASNLNDIYLVSQTVISLLISMVNSPLATAFLPVATEYYVNKTVSEKNEFVSKVYTDIFILAIGATLFEYIFLDVLLDVIAPGFSIADKEILKNVVLLQLPIILFNLIKGVNKGNLQILQMYNISEFTNVMPYMFMILYLLLFAGNINLYLIAIILTLGGLVSILPEIFILYKKGFRYKFCVGIDKDIKIMMKLTLSAVIVACVREMNVLCDKAIGSLLPVGSITMLSYASKITVVAVGIISTAISVVGFSNIAKYRAENDKDKVLKSIADSCNLVNLFIIPVMFYLILYSKEIISLLFGSNSFGSYEVQLTSNLMIVYAIGLIGYGFQDVFTRALHAHKIIKCTIKISIIMVAINICLNLILYRFIGAYGVALSTSISIIVIIPILFIDVKKHIGDFNSKSIIYELFKTILASAVTAIIGYIIKSIFVLDSIFITFVLQSMICCIIYFIICVILKCDAICNILSDLKVLR